jgi:hypothetical protein
MQEGRYSCRVLAAEVRFIKPGNRSVKIVPEAQPGHYSITFYEGRLPLPNLEKLPFRRTQFGALVNGHKQFVALALGELQLMPQDSTLAIILNVPKLPPYTAVPEVGTLHLPDLEQGLGIADKLYLAQH